MADVALISDARASGVGALLPRLRDRCGRRGDVFHFEIDHDGDLPLALATIARIRPRVLAIAGGDRTVSDVITALEEHRAFGSSPPPIALLGGGRDDVLPHVLESPGCPIAGLDRAAVLAKVGFTGRLIERTPVAVTAGGLRRLGLMVRHGSRRSAAMALAPSGGATISGPFARLIVTANEDAGSKLGHQPKLTLLAVKSGWRAILSSMLAALVGRFGGADSAGGHRAHCDDLAIDGADALLLDGAAITAPNARLEAAAPIRFLKLAA